MCGCLADTDRFVAFAARRSLEQLPKELWSELVILLGAGDVVAYSRGAAALLASESTEENAREVLNALERHLENTEADYNQLQLTSMLRAAQLAFIQGKLKQADFPDLGPTLLKRYPSSNQDVDRELVRMLVFLDVDGAAKKFAERLGQDISHNEKMLIGAYAGRLETGWDTIPNWH